MLHVAPEEGSWQIAKRKAKWMVAAIVVPEVVTASTFAQRIAARDSVRQMTTMGQDWTMLHAFYLNIGGVRLQPRESRPFPSNAAQLSYLVASGRMKVRRITKKETWDKSKADKFAKNRCLWSDLVVGLAVRRKIITTSAHYNLGDSDRRICDPFAGYVHARVL